MRFSLIHMQIKTATVGYIQRANVIVNAFVPTLDDILVEDPSTIVLNETLTLE